MAARNTLLTMRSLLGVVDLFWLWLGAGLFQGAIELGKWVTRESVSFLSARVAQVLFPLIWISVALLRAALPRHASLIGSHPAGFGIQ